MADDTNKMLRTIINGQSAMKSELITKIDNVEKKLGAGIDGLENKFSSLEKNMNKGFEKVNERIDKIGKSLAYLEDDAPTRQEFDNLEVRVKKVETKIATI